MRHIANIRLRLATFLLMGGALAWTSCSDDDVCYDVGYDVGNNEEKEVTVRLNISAGDRGGISVTRADEYDGSYEDVNALEGEYMNTLCVFVVDESGYIVEKLTPATSDDGWEGTWPEWTSDALTLATGSYTVYAFSNWETVNNESWNAIIALEVGGSLSDNNLMFDIEDPASLVDIENKMYIPMSGSENITVTESSTSFDVGMNRLVGRVEITIDGETGTDAEDITVTSLSFTNCADKVSLMSGNTASEVSYDKGYSDNTIETTITANSTNNSLAVFYVNETSNNATGFNISLTTTRENGEELSYTATTTTTSISRNYILPIHLTLSSYTLSLAVSAYAGPVGAAERQYYNIEQENADTYTVTLATVTTWFTMTPSLSDSSGNTVTDNVTWEWEQTSANGQLATDEDTTTDMLTASGLTATDGYTYSFNLTATWTSSSGVVHARTFHINIVLDNYRPSYTQAPAHSSWQGWYWDREQLNMYRRH